MKINTPENFRYMKILTAATLLTGIYLHLSRLVFGMYNFQLHLFTPVFEIFFVIPMILGALFQLMFIRKINYRNILERAVYYIATLQFVVSVPLHLRAYVVGSTDYIHRFPPVYSIVTIIMWSYFIYVFTFLKVKKR